MNRIDLQNLSKLRLREARILSAEGQFSGSYYLAGYAVECGLKACIAKSTQRFDFPDKELAQKSFSHRPLELVKVANLYDDLKLAMSANSVLQANWIVVNKWSEQSRYETWSEADADALLNAVARRSNGVLPWIKRHW